MTGRDRNTAGRPENARPRDGLGRPLPKGSVGVERPVVAVDSPTEALDLAQDLLDADLPFHAHEVLEEWWKRAAPEQRALWQGLAQLAVGLTHQRRGNPTGAVAVTSRGAGALASYAADPPYDVDVTGLRAWAARLVADPSVTAPTPRLRRLPPAP